jgi:NAD-dependent dihydropyrimidine dehydrogenase PreA subunit
MPAKTVEDKCIGCGKCVAICPGDVRSLSASDPVAITKYPAECWYCGCCRRVCPTNAIIYLF